ncbi:MAG: hypothetical protein WA213_16855 [Terriglobales bacterium]
MWWLGMYGGGQTPNWTWISVGQPSSGRTSRQWISTGLTYVWRNSMGRTFDSLGDWELFDADEGKDLAVEIREYYIPNFGDWKNNDSYAEEFKKLLRDLKTESPKAA